MSLLIINTTAFFQDIIGEFVHDATQSPGEELILFNKINYSLFWTDLLFSSVHKKEEAKYNEAKMFKDNFDVYFYWH